MGTREDLLATFNYVLRHWGLEEQRKRSTHCPFCGSLKIKYHFGLASCPGSYIYCTACSARGPITDGDYQYVKALKLWDTRVP